MGNIMKKNQGTVQATPQQGAMYAPYPQQPMVQQQPHYVQQPQYAQQQQPQYVQQQPQYVQQQPQYFQQQQQQPQYPPPQSAQYRPSMLPPQQGTYRPSYPSAASMPRHLAPPFSLPQGQDSSMYFENDAFLSNLTGWSPQEIERLRHEFLSYSNPLGVIDREGFRKLYIASLLNMTWEAVEHDSEAAFRNFDINQTGVLDFNEYITACSRMAREVNASYSSPPPPPNPSYNY